MSKPSTNDATKAGFSSSEKSHRHYHRGNIYEIFVDHGVLTHAQVHFPSPSTDPSASAFTDFPYDVQLYFSRFIRA
jgi:hypothetical protein